MRQTIRIFLCGDVMTGRGIDQILPSPCNPKIHESYMRSALDYVRIAEEANGPIPRRADPSYIWGAALHEFDRMRPDMRIINLETSITQSEDYAPKGINYRMSPNNADCLQAAKIDCCVLANNHVLDWGQAGLLDTLSNLERRHIKTAGAGRNTGEAETPAIFDLPGHGRVLVFSICLPTSGVPHSWSAARESPGVNRLPDLSESSATKIIGQIEAFARPGDKIIVSIHWGPNWGYEIASEEQRFARTLIDKGGVSIVHGHSSHHAKGIEVYRDRLILYGCGDFLNDYEGIRGYEAYRDDLALMYFADLLPESGALAALEIVPLQIQKFQLVRPPDRDTGFMRDVINRESHRFGVSAERGSNGIVVSWAR